MTKFNYLNVSALHSFIILSDYLNCETVKVTSEIRTFNPTIVASNDGFLVIARESNAFQVRDLCFSDGYNPELHFSRNKLYIYNRSDQIESALYVDDSSVRSLINSDFYRGIEDIRLYNYRDKVRGIGTSVLTFPDNTYNCSPVTFDLVGNTITNPKRWPSPFNKPFEKNWSPLVHNDNELLIYRIDPLLSYKIEASTAVLFKGDATDKQVSLCGGTPFIKIGDYYLSIAHLPPVVEDRKYYLHRFVVLNTDLEVVELSEAFFLKRRGIEFACGLTQFDNFLIVSYGVSDYCAYYTKIPINSLSKVLVTFS